MSAITAEVWLLTGFLGSGKTTLLQRWIDASPRGSIAVIVNELADLGLDDVFLERIDAQSVLLESGCVCCTIRDDLVEALLGLAARRAAGATPPFVRVVVETTGLADPKPVVHALVSDRRLSAQFHLAGVVTTVDAAHALEQLDHYAESVAQIAAADHLVITKSDACDAGMLDRLEARLATLNPLAERTIAIRSEGVVEMLRSGVRRTSHPVSMSPPAAEHSHGIGTLAIELAKPVGWRAFSDWLQALCLARGRDLLRMKGLVFVTGEVAPRAVNAVHFAIYPSAPLEGETVPRDGVSRLVFIGRDLQRERLERTLRAALKAR